MTLYMNDDVDHGIY